MIFSIPPHQFSNRYGALRTFRIIRLRPYCFQIVCNLIVSFKFQIENMRIALYCLRLPLTIYVDMFFEKLPQYEVELREEGMVFTGFCEDCQRHYYTHFLYLHNPDIELCYLYCPKCTNNLFCASTD
ncbi:hypothetical protein [Olene mendosa nucleopolyhedrovirus]|uniref:Uncharacterized protein n=1 Tax=Olene mendosa nucleopolyhedrovirus TaxID=2933796 RepID=A0AAX3AU50_9ABAC|nr:hypothetical protein QKV28_gp023 [Olene mendosa nucleopolyhedrovirus]UOQ18806.1 hypothetical protein [Olene mendosa nucleopolyhedrovirus]